MTTTSIISWIHTHNYGVPLCYHEYITDKILFEFLLSLFSVCTLATNEQLALRSDRPKAGLHTARSVGALDVSIA